MWFNKNLGNGDAARKDFNPTKAHDWESYKQKDFSDDGTVTYFWRAHTLTVLVVLASILVYVAFFEEVKDDQEYNTKRGLVACTLVFLLLGVTQIPDGPFHRPHPVLWRFVFCLTIVYELALIFILFQTPHNARQLLMHIDKELGQPLTEKNYSGNCRIYDSDNPSDPWHNVWDKIDIFVPTHFFGWWIKTLMLRDWWICTVVSVMFEVLEYTLEHQLSNFSECWWDHWIMDVALCNGLGIYFGLRTVRYLSMKPYHWRGLWNIPTYSGKLKRIVAQFGPRNWIDFDWKPASSLLRWLSVLCIISILLMAEMNTFYLKFVLWLQPAHSLNIYRLILHILAGAVAFRESFQYLDDPRCNQFGRQSWVMLAVVITEFLIIVKYDWETITKPVPMHILYFWFTGVLGIVAWTVWKFFLSNRPTPTANIYAFQDNSYKYLEVNNYETLHQDTNRESSLLKAARRRVLTIEKNMTFND